MKAWTIHPTRIVEFAAIGFFAAVVSSVQVANAADQSADESFFLSIRVIHAERGPEHVDHKLSSLVKRFHGLPFSSYSLVKDVTRRLKPDELRRVQLPGDGVMTLRAHDSHDDKLHLEIGIRDYAFKTKVAISPGSTLAVGGPPYGHGVMILAITYRKGT